MSKVSVDGGEQLAAAYLAGWTMRFAGKARPYSYRRVRNAAENPTLSRLPLSLPRRRSAPPQLYTSTSTVKEIISGLHVRHHGQRDHLQPFTSFPLLASRALICSTPSK